MSRPALLLVAALAALVPFYTARSQDKPKAKPDDSAKAAAALLDTTKVWKAEIRVNGDDWKTMQPKGGGPPGFGGPPPMGGAPASSPKVRWKSARYIPLGLVDALLAGQVLDEDHWAIDGTSECLVPADRPGPFRTALRSAAAVEPSHIEALAMSIPIMAATWVWNSNRTCSVPWAISG